MTDPRNKDAWYETNPSLGYHLKERAILDEIGEDDLDFNIQRLGFWTKQNLKYIHNSLGICTSFRVMVRKQRCCIPTIT